MELKNLMDLLKLLVPIVLVLGAAIVSLLAYIWHDAKRSMSRAMTIETCELYREEEEKSMNRLCVKLRDHRHKPDGSVEVNL